MEIRVFERIKTSLDVDGKEFVINCIFTYGIMMITSFLLCLLVAKDSVGIWEKMVDAFVPTTITFCGMIIIQKVRMLRNNFTALFLLLMIIALAAGYITYFALGNDMEKLIILRVVLVILVALCVICSRNVFKIKDTQIVDSMATNKKKEKSDCSFSRK